IGISSSSSVTSWRRMRLFACPRRPSRMKLWRQNRVHELRDDGVLVAHDTREQRRAVLEQADQILAQLVLDGAVDPGGTRPLGLLQLAQRGRLGHRAIVNRPPPAV